VTLTVVDRGRRSSIFWTPTTTGASAAANCSSWPTASPPGATKGRLTGSSEYSKSVSDHRQPRRIAVDGRDPGSGSIIRPDSRLRGPLWFRKMDRNADGDVSRAEFLGTEAQFRKLDRNGDGLIDLDEAEAAEKGKEEVTDEATTPSRSFPCSAWNARRQGSGLASERPVYRHDAMRSIAARPILQQSEHRRTGRTTERRIQDRLPRLANERNFAHRAYTQIAHTNAQMRRFTPTIHPEENCQPCPHPPNQRAHTKDEGTDSAERQPDAKHRGRAKTKIRRKMGQKWTERDEAKIRRIVRQKPTDHGQSTIHKSRI